MKLPDHISDHFTWYELVHSTTAWHDPSLRSQQESPPTKVQTSLNRLVAMTLEPLRLELGWPIIVTSGYRSPQLNKMVGGSGKSQHVVGEAADCRLLRGFASDTGTIDLRFKITRRVEQQTGRTLGRVSSTFYLFALACLMLDRLDIDQVIYEHGARGAPLWVHVSSSQRQNRREILRISTMKDGSTTTRRITLKQALLLGTTRSRCSV